MRLAEIIRKSTRRVKGALWQRGREMEKDKRRKESEKQ